MDIASATSTKGETLPLPAGSKPPRARNIMQSIVSECIGSQPRVILSAVYSMTEPGKEPATAKIGNNLLTLTEELQS
jgi:hypothetical protein